jgi:hypothetical protein
MSEKHAGCAREWEELFGRVVLRRLFVQRRRSHILRSCAWPRFYATGFLCRVSRAHSPAYIRH